MAPTARSTLAFERLHRVRIADTPANLEFYDNPTSTIHRPGLVRRPHVPVVRPRALTDLVRDKILS